MNFNQYAEKQGLSYSSHELETSFDTLKESLLHNSDISQHIKLYADFISNIFRYSNGTNIEINTTGALEYWVLNANSYNSNELKTLEGYLSIIEKNLRELKNDNTALFEIALNTIVYIIQKGLSIEVILDKSIPKPDEIKQEVKKELQPELIKVIDSLKKDEAVKKVRKKKDS